MRMHYVPLPDDVAAALREAGVRRVVGTLNEHPFSRALHGWGSGPVHLMLGRGVLREAGLAYGDPVIVSLKPDPRPDDPDLPDELVAALQADHEAGKRFYGMTPGRQRSLAHYVHTAKRPATRERRALELAHKLRTYTLHGDTPPER